MTPDPDPAPAHEAHEPMSDWLEHVAGPTDFSRTEIRSTIHTLDEHGFSTADIFQAIGPIAAFAHAWDLPIEPTAATVAGVYHLSDASFEAVLDALEELQEGEPRPPEGER